MSGQILLKDVSLTQHKAIYEMLNIKEIDPDKGDWKWKKPKYKVLKNIRLFFIKEGILYLPYNFIVRNIGIHPNNNKKHEKIEALFKGELRKNQVGICEDAMKFLKKNNSVILNVYASFGKTVVSSYLSSKLGYKTVILLSSNLIKSWKGTIDKFLPSSKVWVVQNKKVPPEDTDFYICMEGRIRHIPEDHIKKIGTLIIDECHQFGTEKRAHSILRFQPRYTIALSATFERRDGFHRVIEEVCGKEKIVKKYEGKFKVFRYATGIETPITPGKMGADWQALRESISLNQERNKMILNISKVLIEAGKKVLILTWLNEKHVHVLIDVLKKEITSLDYLSGSKNNYKDSDILLGTISKIGTGFDEKETCDNFGGKRINVLIVAGSVKSETLLEQMVGRVFRAENPVVVHIVDSDNISRKHWLSCRKWYLGANGEIKNVSSLSKEALV